MVSYKKMGIVALSIMACFLVLIAGVVVLMDPFFHYHDPLEWQKYPLDSNNQRYINDGVARNFEYNALITGTSMTENFKVTELEALFDVNAIKVSYSGASYKEIDDAVERAIQRQPNLRMVVRGLDLNRFLRDKDEMSDFDYPYYLYDDCYFNDMSYLFNKDILLDEVFFSLYYSIKKIPSTTFDEYSNWNDAFTFGKDAVLKTYTRPQKSDTKQPFTQHDVETVKGTIVQNITSLAKENPQISFYYFLTPYSIVWWDEMDRKGDVQRQLDAQELAIRMMLECENIHVFSFIDDFDAVTDLSNYKDAAHYHEDYNSYMLACMAEDTHRLTKENCEDYFVSVEEFYSSYPYDSVFE